MLNRPTQSSSSDAQSHNSHKQFSPKKSQHGIYSQHHDSLLIRRPILVDVPTETLTGITAHLDPPMLLNLGRVNQYLYCHVKDDNTWRRAFANQFLGVGPESDFNEENLILLRRLEKSWRQEFISRYRLRQRWERSRSVTTTIAPVHHLVDGMHLMPAHGLLTASLEYGIIARSLPLTGKILPGYLDASGSRAGLGVGNPNAEFTPNITSYDMASEGGTGQIVWGSRAGDVLFLSAPKTMEGSGRRRETDARRSSAFDNHEGAVIDAKWIDVSAGWVVTGGIDGRVKLWESRTARCAWSSQPILAGLAPDHCLKVAGSAGLSFVVAALKSGDVHIWTGFDMSGSPVEMPIEESTITNPVRTTNRRFDTEASPAVTVLQVDHSGKSPTVLIAYENNPYFYRVRVDATTKAIDITPFGDPNFGSLSRVTGFFRTHNTDPLSNVVLAGDHLGCVSFYDWDAEEDRAAQNVVACTPAIIHFHKIEAFGDGAAVTSIAWNGVVLACGSVGGQTAIFDGLRLTHLRSFASPIPKSYARRGPLVHLVGAAEAATAQAAASLDPNAVQLAQTLEAEVQRQQREWEKVRHIVLGQDKDVVFVGVGDKVMAWKAGPVSKYGSGKGGVRGRNASGVLHPKTRVGTSRFFGQKEMNQAILESYDILEDKEKALERRERAHGNARAQRSGMDSLGLSEVEALEYVLMLSRDEANARARAEEEASTGAGSSQTQLSLMSDAEEGVFEADMDLNSDDGSVAPASVLSGSTGSSVGSDSVRSSSSSGRSSITTSPRAGRPIPHILSRHGSAQGTPRFSPSPSSLTNQKVQVSPPHRAEPTEASPEWMEGDVIEDEMGGTRLGIEDHHFPTLAEGSGSSGSERKMTRTKGKAKATRPRQSKNKTKSADKPNPPALSAPSPPRVSAWTTPLSKRLSTSPPTVLRSSGVPSVSPVARSSTSTIASKPQLQTNDHTEAELDDDLRFALELSLAESMSRGSA